MVRHPPGVRHDRQGGVREDARFELLDALSKHAAEYADELDASEAPRLGVTKRVVDRRSVAGLVA
jgi:hypothetical protein